MQRAAWAVLMCVCFVGVFAVDAKTEGEELARLFETINRYQADRLDDVWMFPKTPPQLGIEAFMPYAEKLGERQNAINALLRKYRHVSPLAERIAAQFHSKVLTTIEVGGYTRTMWKETAKEKPFLGGSRPLEIVFIPKDQSEKHSHVMYYYTPWRAVMIHGLRWPEPIFTASIFGGLRFALKHMDGILPPQAGSRTDILESIEYHDFDAAILNAASGGGFFSVIDGVAARSADARNWPDLCSRLTLDDLRRLDQTVGCQVCGPMLARFILPRYFLALGARWINANISDPAERIEKRMEFERWLRTVLAPGRKT